MDSSQEAAPAQATALACRCFFLSIMDRYLFGLLRWTLGPESRGARRRSAAQKPRESDNTISDCQLPIANLHCTESVSLTEVEKVNKIGSWQLAIGNALLYIGRSAV